MIQFKANCLLLLNISPHSLKEKSNVIENEDEKKFKRKKVEEES